MRVRIRAARGAASLLFIIAVVCIERSSAQTAALEQRPATAQKPAAAQKAEAPQAPSNAGTFGLFLEEAKSTINGVISGQPPQPTAGYVVESPPIFSGYVVDEDGQPIANARVDIGKGAPRSGNDLLAATRYPDCVKWVETDKNGRFEFPNVNTSLKFQLLCTAAGKSGKVTKLIDPRKGSTAIQLATAPTVFTPELTIRGQVVDEQGNPIAGALIEATGAENESSRWWGSVSGANAAVSDRQGRFVMPLGADFEGVDLTIEADGYAGAQFPLVKPGANEQRLTLPAGAGVTGVLTFDGKPVAGVHVAVAQVIRDSSSHFIERVEAVTDDKGRFTFEHLPANRQYLIFTPISHSNAQNAIAAGTFYVTTGTDGQAQMVAISARDRSPGTLLTTKKFRLPSDGQTRDLGTLSEIPGLRVAGRIVLPEGISLPSKARLFINREPAWDNASVAIDDDGRFEIAGLAPETYTVRLQFDGFQFDRSRLRYQVLDDNTFGIRVTESIEDLVIPIKSAFSD